MTRAVLVINMLRGFLEEGYPLYCGPRARRIIPNVQTLLEEETRQGSKIFFLCDHHTPDGPEFQMFPPHRIEGTTEAEVIPELSQYPGEVIPKRHFSAFFDTPLEEELAGLKPERLIVCGVLTDICLTARKRLSGETLPGKETSDGKETQGWYSHRGWGLSGD